jgi:uncharacterized phiE125 gp8 family phage protein
MPLPTVTDAKAYLRVDLPTEDPQFTLLLARAKASIEGLLGYGITAAAVTFVAFGRRFSSNELQLPGPFAASPAPVVTDVDGVIVDPATYVLDSQAGKIRAKYDDYIFTSSQYTVVATIGLSAHPDYDARLEAVASSAILDLVAHLYENRFPGMSAEGGGGVSLTPDAIPARIISDLMALPCTRGLLVA